MVRDIKVLPLADQKEVLDALPLTVMRQSTNEMSVGWSKQFYAQNTKVGVFQKHQEKKAYRDRECRISIRLARKSGDSTRMRQETSSRGMLNNVIPREVVSSGFLWCLRVLC